MAAAIEAKAPQLLELTGVGPDSAAVLLVAVGDNPERRVSEASFAVLCGVSPLESSSGKTSRRRLNRGGNRQANAALYRITLVAAATGRTQPRLPGQRASEGKSRREAIRCLKRYIAREIYRHLTDIILNAPSPTAA